MKVLCCRKFATAYRKIATKCQPSQLLKPTHDAVIDIHYTEVSTYDHRMMKVIDPVIWTT